MLSNTELPESGRRPEGGAAISHSDTPEGRDDQSFEAGVVLNLMLPHGSRVPLVYPLRTTCLMLHLFRVHTKCPDTCNLHASE